MMGNVPHVMRVIALRLMFIAAVLGFVCTAGAERSFAHEIRPAVVTITLQADGRYGVAITANFEALLAGIGPQHTDSDRSPEAAAYNVLRRLGPDELKSRIERFLPRWREGIAITFDGQRVSPALHSIEVPATGDPAIARISEVRFEGDVPAGARMVGWRYGAEFGSSVLRVRRHGVPEPVTSWLKDGTPSEPVSITEATARSRGELFVEFLGLGFTHILPKGLDHILFVLGLYLLSTQWRPLLVQVTAFTVAHSITLGLGLYGVLELPPRIVEPLIAASIVYVAVENLATSKLSAWRPFVVFGFGLLHGLGFAGIMHEIGLARGDYAVGLLAFNIGVELAQIAVILLAFMATGLWFRERPWYRQRIVWPASAMIGLIGLYWSIERLAGVS